MDLVVHITGRNLVLVAGVFVATQALKQAFPRFWATHAGQRLLPALGLLLGVGAALAGAGAGAPHVGARVALGLVVGAGASLLFQLGKVTVLGWGARPAQAKE